MYLYNTTSHSKTIFKERSYDKVSNLGLRSSPLAPTPLTGHEFFNRGGTLQIEHGVCRIGLW